MRVAVVGAGRMGQLHARLLTNAKAVSELVVADADVDQAKAVAEGLGAEVASDPMDALESVDASLPRSNWPIMWMELASSSRWGFNAASTTGIAPPELP